VAPGNAAARSLLAGLETPAEPLAEKPVSVPLRPPVASERVRPAPAPAEASIVTRPLDPPALDPGPSAPAREDPARLLRGPVSLPSTPAAGPAPVSPIRVAPDPLAPRIVNAPPPAGTTPATVAPPRGSAIIERGPPAPRHAIAGYVKDVPGAIDTPRQVTPVAPSREDIAGGIANRDLEPLSIVEPVYPADAFRNRIEGWVEVEFTVSEQGTVRDVDVVDADPRGIFEPAASRAVSAWRYRPRVVNGRPVPQRTSVTLRFNVDG
jgi:protein TonB